MLLFINGVFSPVPPGSKGSASTGPMSAAVAGVPRLPPGRKPPGPPPGPPPPQVLALYGIPVRRPPGTDTGRTHTLLHRAGPGTSWSWYQLVLVPSDGPGTFWSWYLLVLVPAGPGTSWSGSLLVLVPSGPVSFWSWFLLVLVPSGPGTSWYLLVQF